MNKALRCLVKASIISTLIILASCAAERETTRIAKKPEGYHPVPAPWETTRCEDDTAKSINMSGIETLPFMRINFFDADDTGLQDMIVGNKNGSIYLYRNSGDPIARPWQRVPGYFEGAGAGAFSSPALADLDGDGKAELIVGTGGFSSGSGKILFFKNEGSANNPAWKRISDLALSVGNDAAVTVADYNFDGKPDIIACNSEGKIFFFKNVSKAGAIKFVKDNFPPVKANFGMYAVPAARKIGDKVVLIIGNSMGKLFMFEIKKSGSGISALQYKIGIITKTFASPAFASLLDSGRVDLVVADGDGALSYYESSNGDFTRLKKKEALFNNRIFAGPACAPTISHIGGKTYMVIGNIDGTFRLFEHDKSSQGIPWKENREYLSGIKVQGFSRGVLAQWEGKEMLITGQSNGKVRAFIKTGGKTVWEEKTGFFQGVNIKEHSTPMVFDLDGDGRWELISGSADGRVYAYRIREMRNGGPVWERIEGVFDDIRGTGFSVPAIAGDGKAIYLFVGQQDGGIRTFKADAGIKPLDYRSLKFAEMVFTPDIRMNGHSSPYVSLNNGVFDLVVGDYNGNLRRFFCRNSI